MNALPIVALLVFSTLLCAQTAEPEKKTATGSIEGTVRDAGTGAVLRDVVVNISGPGYTDGVDGDDAGRFRITKVPEGLHRVTAVSSTGNTRGFGPRVSKLVRIAAGEEVKGLEFRLDREGSISGRILNESKEPLPGMSVMLIGREYTAGALRNVYASMATTDDRGEYSFPRVKSGRAYYVMSGKRPNNLSSVSNAPLDPKMRKLAAVPTFYPRAASIEGAQALVLRPGEKREGVDLVQIRAPSFCISGSPGVPEGSRFALSFAAVTSGWHGEGGFFVYEPGGRIGAGGRIRVCDLAPGDYVLTITEDGKEDFPKTYGKAAVSIVDRDVDKLFVQNLPGLSIPGEIVWADKAPEAVPAQSISVRLQPITRAGYVGEQTDRKSPVPGSFEIGPLLVDDFKIIVQGLPDRAYIKDITYGDASSVKYSPLRPGTAIGEGKLRIVLGADGGQIRAAVTDKDSKPVPDVSVAVFPLDHASEAALAAAMITAKSDQNGNWTSAKLAPGKYFVLATRSALDLSPECVNKLWRSKTRATEVEVKANGEVAAKLELVELN